MKKICTSVLLMIVFAIPALAVSVCAKDSIVSVVLDPSINGNSSTYSNSTGVWKIIFSYGKVSGISTCVSAKGKTEQLTLTANDTYLESSGGEATGRYCWCKMTHPMNSLWVYYRDVGYVTDCASGCLRGCADIVKAQQQTNVRTMLFGSVADANAAF